MYIHLHVSSFVRAHKITCACIIFSFMYTCMNRGGEGMGLCILYVYQNRRKREREKIMHVYICMTNSLALFFFPFSEGMSSHETEQGFFLSLSLSLSSWFSPLPPEVNLVIDLGEWCTSCGVGMTVLSSLLHLVCTALRGLDNYFFNAGWTSTQIVITLNGLSLRLGVE